MYINYKIKGLNLLKTQALYINYFREIQIFKSYAIINCPLFFMQISTELVNFTL